MRHSVTQVAFRLNFLDGTQSHLWGYPTGLATKTYTKGTTSQKVAQSWPMHSESLRYTFKKSIDCNKYTSAMLHDEAVFPDADKFDPERFIKNGTIRDDILDPEVVATFGFGRRFVTR